MLPTEILLHGQSSNFGLHMGHRPTTSSLPNGYCSGNEGHRLILGLNFQRDIVKSSSVSHVRNVKTEIQELTTSTTEKWLED